MDPGVEGRVARYVGADLERDSLTLLELYYLPWRVLGLRKTVFTLNADPISRSKLLSWSAAGDGRL